MTKKNELFDEIAAIGCTQACFGGMKGNQTCHGCDGTGSQLFFKGEYFPNTKEGWDEAVKFRKSTALQEERK